MNKKGLKFTRNKSDELVIDLTHHKKGLDGRIIVNLTIYDNGSDEPQSLDVTVEISNCGINIAPTNPQDYYNDLWRRETWVEFYGGRFLTWIWDGTQEDPIEKIIMLEKGVVTN